MKKPLLLLCALALSITTVFSQQYYMTTPEGFGAGTTGGGTASPTTVTNETQLKAALTASGAGVVLVSGTITISALMKVKVVDKTLIGLPGARLVNNVQTASGSGILYLSNGSSNVILRNLIFEGPGAYDVDGSDNMCADGCNKLWVDHCEFQDGMDGNFDIKGQTDNVTVSWCKFIYLKPAKAGGSGGAPDHRYTNLVGSGSGDAPADKHFSVTWQNCYWAEGCKERMPRARNAELHMLNCYYNTSVTGAVALGLGGGINNLSCYVENTHFARITNMYKTYNGTDGGTHTLTYTGCMPAGNNIGTTPKPTYAYTTYPASDVARVVGNSSCGAGATLQVTSGGVISATVCTTTDLETTDLIAGSTLVYPNPSSGTFRVKSKEDMRTISVLTSGGEMIYKSYVTGKEAAIEDNFDSGIYFVRIENVAGSMEMVKFLKTK